ncbi:hypothetical protein FB45DRAFT_447197 [Roridomyces roridus]|uniref:Uncharacterized protein n=1 Tax=Roridomyces roridus TaxID=1738132 RepID=A0AAD7C172_9AGAR|nr:hypothetical protein FB45DRAFT_447197 [Roridomyces roridus]
MILTDRSPKSLQIFLVWSAGFTNQAFSQDIDHNQILIPIFHTQLNRIFRLCLQSLRDNRLMTARSMYSGDHLVVVYIRAPLVCLHGCPALKLTIFPGGYCELIPFSSGFWKGGALM